MDDPEETLAQNETLGPSPVNGKNKMEIRGTVLGHSPGTAYRFNRTIAMKEWYRVLGKWKVLKELPEGTNDKAHRSDEDDLPNNDHIYSVDSPGFVGPTTTPNVIGTIPIADKKDATEVVFMLSATETVEVQVGAGPWTQAGSLDWFSVTWLEKTGASWRRKAGLNKIDQGSIDNLGIADEPPATF
jgi:hypothetical protein